MNRILLAALAAAGLATGPVQAAPPLIVPGPADRQAQQSSALLVPVHWHRGHHRHWHRHRDIGDLVRELEPDAEPGSSAAAFGASQPASGDTARPWLDPRESGR